MLEPDLALKRLGGRQSLYDRLVQSFSQDAPAELAALARPLQDGRRPDVVRGLHTLRGLAGAVGGSALAAAAGAQEQGLQASQASPLGAVDLKSLQALLDETLAALRALAPPQAPPAQTPPRVADPLDSLGQLRQLLVDRNMRSVGACEQLARSAPASWQPEFGRLADAVARLDFTVALAHCEALLARMPAA